MKCLSGIMRFSYSKIIMSNCTKIIRFHIGFDCQIHAVEYRTSVVEKKEKTMSIMTEAIKQASIMTHE